MQIAPGIANLVIISLLYHIQAQQPMRNNELWVDNYKIVITLEGKRGMRISVAANEICTMQLTILTMAQCVEYTRCRGVRRK